MNVNGFQGRTDIIRQSVGQILSLIIRKRMTIINIVNFVDEKSRSLNLKIKINQPLRGQRGE